jgi:hypothetical protein
MSRKTTVGDRRVESFGDFFGWIDYRQPIIERIEYASRRLSTWSRKAEGDHEEAGQGAAVGAGNPEGGAGVWAFAA